MPREEVPREESFVCVCFMAALGVFLLHGLFLVAASRSYSLVMMSRLLIAVVILCGAQSLELVGSVVVAVSPAACGTFPDQGSNPCPLHWQVDLLPLNHQGSPSEETLCLSLMKGWEEFP